MAFDEEMLRRVAQQLGQELMSKSLSVVFAESCTGGAMAAAITAVPGISLNFCGSAVTYQNETKTRWLGVSEANLNDPAIGPVSPETAEQMCLGVLKATPAAEMAISVTGHLGPNAPAELDGVIYVGVARRGEIPPVIERHELRDFDVPSDQLRARRQLAATIIALQAGIRSAMR